MDASILVVGDTAFCNALLELTRNTSASIVEVAPNPFEATLFIQAQQPDLLIVQASQSGSLELCRDIKSQSRLAWIYCIVLDDQLVWENPFDAIAQPVSIASPSLLASIELQIAALNMGADACFPTNLELLAEPLDKPYSRLLQTQIQSGLRRVHNYRELMRTNDLLSAIALSDPLTELNNRRALEWELPRQIQNARARNMPISLVMLDVDFFKTINDSYGHLVGDRALQLLSARLRHNLRFYDTPFRYGGEEFVIILSDTGSQEAAMIAQRLCRLVAEQPFVINETLDLNITISAGAASLRVEDDARGTSLLHRADQNLLKAKSSGRNQVVASKDEE